MASQEQKRDAVDRLDHVADVYWGLHATIGKPSGTPAPDQIVERVLADYALVGKVPIDILKKRAQERVRTL